jgi:large subunit ribosomal protein L6
MSRIGKKGIAIPDKTEISLQETILKVKGPLGELSLEVDPNLNFTVADNMITISPKTESLEANALWGTYTSHVTNMVKGVNTPFQKKLFLEGIGYRVEVKGDKMVFALGFSHPVEVPIPDGIKVVVEKNAITISGIDKASVGGFAARIRDLKKPEPYKGKGLRYEGEVIKIKQGKKSV